MVEILFALVLLAACVLFWAIVMIIIGRASGWHQLSRHYHEEHVPFDTVFRFRSAQVGGLNYSAALKFAVNPLGMQISVFAPFAFGHPPFFVPWEEITVKKITGRLFSNGYELRCNRVSSTTVRINPGLGNAIAAAGGQNWEENLNQEV